MSLQNIKVGKNPPHDCNVLIEIPMNADPVKYEFDKETGIMWVDRIISTSMCYPCNYGFIPNTLSDDGDPVDVLVLASFPIRQGVMINVRPIGVLITEDEKGTDEKVLAVPTTKVDPLYEKVNSIEDLPELLLAKISHFFEQYKALEKGKWVKVGGWKKAEEGKAIIANGIARYSKEYKS